MPPIDLSLLPFPAPVSEPEWESPSDEELMTAIQQRDPRALETLLTRHTSRLYSAIHRVLPANDGNADDVMQTCRLELWNQADRFSPAKGSALSWMMTMAKRRAIDSLRRNVAYRGACDRVECETRHLTPHGNDEDNCASADLSQLLLQQLSTLPVAQQTALSLGFLKGMSQREIARVTETPLGTVKTRLELGLSKLRTKLGKLAITSSYAT